MYRILLFLLFAIPTQVNAESETVTIGSLMAYPKHGRFVIFPEVPVQS